MAPLPGELPLLATGPDRPRLAGRPPRIFRGKAHASSRTPPPIRPDRPSPTRRAPRTSSAPSSAWRGDAARRGTFLAKIFGGAEADGLPELKPFFAELRRLRPSDPQGVVRALPSRQRIPEPQVTEPPAASSFGGAPANSSGIRTPSASRRAGSRPGTSLRHPPVRPAARPPEASQRPSTVRRRPGATGLKCDRRCSTPKDAMSHAPRPRPACRPKLVCRRRDHVAEIERPRPSPSRGTQRVVLLPERDDPSRRTPRRHVKRSPSVNRPSTSSPCRPTSPRDAGEGFLSLAHRSSPGEFRSEALRVRRRRRPGRTPSWRFVQAHLGHSAPRAPRPESHLAEHRRPRRITRSLNDRPRRSTGRGRPRVVDLDPPAT